MYVMNTTTNATHADTATTNAPALAAAERAYRFIERGHAFGFAQRGTKPLRVMLGDDERFWVVTPADAARLERGGYEYAI
jgi:hypothetical protein